MQNSERLLLEISRKHGILEKVRNYYLFWTYHLQREAGVQALCLNIDWVPVQHLGLGFVGKAAFLLQVDPCVRPLFGEK